MAIHCDEERNGSCAAPSPNRRRTQTMYEAVISGKRVAPTARTRVRQLQIFTDLALRMDNNEARGVKTESKQKMSPEAKAVQKPETKASQKPEAKAAQKSKLSRERLRVVMPEVWQLIRARRGLLALGFVLMVIN